MIVLTFKVEQGLKLGVKTGRGVLDVGAAAAALDYAAPVTPESFFAAGSAAIEPIEKLVELALDQPQSASWLYGEDELTPGPCVPAPGKIICVGLNYRRHAAESGMQPPTTPLLFSKFNNSLAAPNELITLSPHAEQYDYEAELAVVIGETARDVPVERALSYVLGYCNANDLSARDLQTRTSQWLLGKTLDKFMPLGPYLATAGEVADPQNLPIRCWLNGELRQDSNTSDMIFTVAEVISYVSQYMTLEPGDVISTGTPEGVILGMREKKWLKPGDEIVVEVGMLGRLINILC